MQQLVDATTAALRTQEASLRRQLRQAHDLLLQMRAGAAQQRPVQNAPQHPVQTAAKTTTVEANVGPAGAATAAAPASRAGTAGDPPAGERMLWLGAAPLSSAHPFALSHTFTRTVALSHPILTQARGGEAAAIPAARGACWTGGVRETIWAYGVRVHD